MDNFSIALPKLEEGVKTYLHDSSDEIGYKPFTYDLEKGYKIISEILQESSIYDREGADGWYRKNIMYYYSDNTYISIYIVYSKHDSPYFNDSYIICVDSSNYKSIGNGFYCAYSDETLYNELLNYYAESEKVASNYVQDPRYK